MDSRSIPQARPTAAAASTFETLKRPFRATVISIGPSGVRTCTAVPSEVPCHLSARTAASFEKPYVRTDAFVRPINTAPAGSSTLITAIPASSRPSNSIAFASR